jgi:hypothetical protein
VTLPRSQRWFFRDQAPRLYQLQPQRVLLLLLRHGLTLEARQARLKLCEFVAAS